MSSSFQATIYTDELRKYEYKKNADATISVGYSWEGVNDTAS